MKCKEDEFGIYRSEYQKKILNLLQSKEICDGDVKEIFDNCVEILLKRKIMTSNQLNEDILNIENAL